MTSSKHTPGPWTAEPNGGDDDDERALIICATAGTFDGQAHMIAQADRTPEADGDPEANAARIVACVNALEGCDPAALAELVTAAEVAFTLLESLADRDPQVGLYERNTLRAALAAFRGEA